MGPLEWEKWERFCETGLISDYLNYRTAAGPWDEPDEGESVDADNADRHQGGGALGQEYGKL